MSYSARIDDPRFEIYKHRNRDWKFIISVIGAAIAVGGFYIYGETSFEIDNPEAIQIGMGLGLLFLLIGFYQARSKTIRQTWDGIVVDKKKKHTSKNIGYDHIKAERIVYIVVIQADNGKTVEICNEDDDTVFNYFEVGDKVRHHGGLHTYEKFDKSGDEIVFCNVCGFIHNIEEDVCRCCGCPLLK